MMSQKVTKFNELLLKVSQSAIIDSGDYIEAAKYVTAVARSGLNVERCSVFTLDQALTKIDCVLLNSGNTIDFPDNAFTDTDYPIYFSALKEKRFIIAPDAQSNKDTVEFLDYLKEKGITSILDAPIRKGGIIVGTLCCEHSGKPREWSNEEQSFLGSLADILGRALTAEERLQAQKDLKETNRHLSRLIDERTHHLKLAFQQISEQEKMASLGQLVAGIAHEINNPLGLGITTVSHLEQLTYDISKSFSAGTITQSQFKEFLEGIKEGNHLLSNNLHRAVELVKSFKQIAVDQSDSSFMMVNLADTLNNIVKSLKPELSKKHQTQIRLTCPSSIALRSCPGTIAQIITNLVINAGIHAFPDAQKERTVTVNVEESEDQVHMTVEDNGQGISEKVKDSLFEPFVTTRRNKGGSGLGLNIVHNLVTNTLQGSIDLDSQAGKFTRFIIHLPKQ